MNRLKQLREEWNASTLMKIFEIEVIDKRTNEKDYIIFDIEIEGNKFKATHIPLTEAEETSNKIAFKTVNIDSDFSLDENLQELFEECTTAIMDSDFYTLE